jgi:hypothetical protein
VAVAALLMSAGSAFGGTAYSWSSGAGSSAWTSLNWGQNGYPGSAAGDTATIADSAQNPVTLSSSLGNAINSLTLDSDTSNEAVSFSHTSGTLDVNGLVSVLGGFDGSSTYYAATATFTSTDLAFTPNQMLFDGYPGGTGITGHAIGVFDVDVTLVGDTGADFTIGGPVDLDIADAAMVYPAEVSLASDADILITGNTSAGDSVFRMSSFGYASGARPIEFNGESGGLIVEINTSP